MEACRGQGDEKVLSLVKECIVNKESKERNCEKKWSEECGKRKEWCLIEEAKEV